MQTPLPHHLLKTPCLQLHPVHHLLVERTMRCGVERRRYAFSKIGFNAIGLTSGGDYLH